MTCIKVFFLCFLFFISCKNSVTNKGADETDEQSKYINEAALSSEVNGKIISGLDTVSNKDSSLMVKADLMDGEQDASYTKVDEDTKEKQDSSTKTASNPKKSYKYPVVLDSIQFEYMSFNYDTIDEGDVIKNKFYFKNLNKYPIEVESTYPDCGCTIPSFPFLPIEPGESGFIGITYNSVGKDGPQNSGIHIKFKHIKKEVILQLKGFVKKK